MHSLSMISFTIETIYNLRWTWLRTFEASALFSLLIWILIIFCSSFRWNEIPSTIHTSSDVWTWSICPHYSIMINIISIIWYDLSLYTIRTCPHFESRNRASYFDWILFFMYLITEEATKCSLHLHYRYHLKQFQTVLYHLYRTDILTPLTSLQFIFEVH